MILIVHPSDACAQHSRSCSPKPGRSRGRINYASSGFGGITHMAGELLDNLANVKMTHIPYKGGAPSVAATLGGEVDLTFAATPVGIPHIRSGRVRALAVSSATRSAVIPALPTLARRACPTTT
jgi:tripartite-type tricarboxylate transporter receptor subunit TctC